MRKTTMSSLFFSGLLLISLLLHAAVSHAQTKATDTSKVTTPSFTGINTGIDTSLATGNTTSKQIDQNAATKDLSSTIAIQEICGDGVDNNGDKQIDEGCQTTNTQNTTCSDGSTAKSYGCVLLKEGDVAGDSEFSSYYSDLEMPMMICYDENAQSKIILKHFPHPTFWTMVQDEKTGQNGSPIFFQNSSTLYYVEKETANWKSVNVTGAKHLYSGYYMASSGNIIAVDRDAKNGKILLLTSTKDSAGNVSIAASTEVENLSNPRYVALANDYLFLLTDTSLIVYNSSKAVVQNTTFASALGGNYIPEDMFSDESGKIIIAFHNLDNENNGIIATIDTSSKTATTTSAFTITPYVTNVKHPTSVGYDKGGKKLFIVYSGDLIKSFSFDADTASYPVDLATLSGTDFVKPHSFPAHLRVADNICVDTSQIVIEAGQCVPQQEVCDNKDNDCDGQSDENNVCGNTSTNACTDVMTDTPCSEEGAAFLCTTAGTLAQAGGVSGIQKCVGGFMTECSSCGDQCDGHDNDKDNQTDEDAANVSCYTGAAGTAGVGICRSGKSVCTNGVYGSCQYEQTPITEVCGNGLDDDCDGSVDENCSTGTKTDTNTKTDTQTKTSTQTATGTTTATQTQTNTTTSTGTGTNTATTCHGMYSDDCKTGEQEYCQMQDGSNGLHGCITQIDGTGMWGCCVQNNVVDTCNGIDDDLDGDIDDAGDTRQCYSGAQNTKDVGACKAGTQSCVAGGTLIPGTKEYSPNWSECSGEIIPTTEVCDAKYQDEDCDGVANEGCECVEGEERECGQSSGICAPGKQKCTNGKWGSCEGAVLPGNEVCNGQDDDCDGETDENQTTTCYDGPDNTEGVGLCHGGTSICSATTSVAAVGQTVYTMSACTDQVLPVDESCDGLDNDCDGVVDEGCDCQDGSEEACGDETGECSQGVRFCSYGKWGECKNTVGPAKEICDGLDNDCDGLTDENANGETLTQSYYNGTKGTENVGICTAGIQSCIDGKWQVTQSAIIAGDESCDSHDNDCDGRADEGCECVDGATRSCGEETGACTAGTQTCVNGGWGDCTGDISSTDETCNALDDDCDGSTDEDLSNTCYSGPQGTENVGICQGGVQVCTTTTSVAGATTAAWGSCTGEVTPQTESCNGLDDDCDGTTDEGCDCTDGTTQACGDDTGACAPGIQTCAQGVWGECSGKTGPTDEICDGIDNDCDGQVDEDLVLSCYSGEKGTENIGECKPGNSTCTNGTWSSCIGEQLAATEIYDGKDNDCDGGTDEDFDCVPGSTQACGKDTGECTAGIQTCDQTGKWGDCIGETTSTTESCNGKDDDCDGVTDPGCECTDGTTQTCGDDTGACAAGTQTCVNGGWGDCAGMISATEEACDGIDNDCDGSIDEGLVVSCYDGTQGTLSVGACVAGTSTCSNGTWGSCSDQVTPATEEICDDSIDNDCDGIVDEGCSECAEGETRACGSDEGACVAGTQKCENGAWSESCEGETGATDETCDGVDNDCDGSTDEGFDLGQTCTVGIGACAANGQVICASDGLGTTCDATAGTPAAAEICDNGIDDDCDDVKDQGCTVTDTQTSTATDTDTNTNTPGDTEQNQNANADEDSTDVFVDDGTDAEEDLTPEPAGSWIAFGSGCSLQFTHYK